MLRTGYIFMLAILFAAVVFLLKGIEFWGAVGLPEPSGYLWQGFLFLGLLWVLQKGLFIPYLKTLEEREEQTIHKTERAEATREKANEFAEDYRKKLEEIRQRSVLEREQMALAAESEEKEMLARAKGEGKRSLKKSLDELEAEEAAAEKQLKEAQATLAEEILSQVLNTSKPSGGGTPRLVALEAKKGS